MHKFITPRVGSDVTLIILTLITTKFQSTLPVWGATQMQIPLPVRPIDFNPRSPCGERQLPALQRGTDGHFNPRSPCGERHFNDVYSVLLDDISIHAPRVGSDLTNGVSAMSTPLFQSTLPVWGATSLAADTIPAIAVISIHAPRVGSDDHVAYVSGTALDFNPRSPCGERQKLSDCFLWAIRISIHAPRVGSDRQCVLK